MRYDENGDIHMTITWEDRPSFYRYILSFGDAAEILAPDECRKEFSDILKKISDRYS